MSGRVKYTAARLLQLVPILLGLSLLAFALLCLSPGDPAQKRLTSQGIAVSREVLEQTREEMGLNQPFWRQFLQWLGNTLRGDLGTSYKDGLPVAGKLLAACGNTIVLAACSLALSLLLALPLGVLAAVKRRGLADRLIGLTSFIGSSIPNFLLAAGLMYLLCVKLRWFPVLAKGSIRGLALPVLSLSIPLAASLTRQARAEVLEQLSKSYVQGARVRGVKRWRVLWAAVYNALPHLLTVAGLSVGTLLGGSVVIETMFSWPGLGKLAMDAITARDYPVVQGFVLFTGTAYVLINLLADLCCHAIDPRTGEGAAQ